MKNLIDCWYRGNEILVQLRQSIDAHGFIHPPVIHRTLFYQWFRDIMESSVINTLFPKYHQHTLVTVCHCSCYAITFVTQLVAELETNRRLVNVTSRTFPLPTRATYMPTHGMNDFPEIFDEPDGRYSKRLYSGYQS